MKTVDDVYVFVWRAIAWFKQAGVPGFILLGLLLITCAPMLGLLELIHRWKEGER